MKRNNMIMGTAIGMLICLISAFGLVKELPAGEAPYIKAWLLNGYYANSDQGTRLSNNYLGNETTLTPSSGSMDGGKTWQTYTSATSYIDLNAYYGAADNCAAYAHTYVYSPTDQTVQLWLGSDDGIKVWLNGINVHNNDVYRSYSADADKINIDLVTGWNRLLIKVSEGGYDWGFSARIYDVAGQAISGLLYQLDKPNLLSYIQTWLLNGYYPNADQDKSLSGIITKDYLGNETTVMPSRGSSDGGKTWQAYTSATSYIDLNAYYGAPDNCAAYAHTYVYSPTNQTVQLWLGSDDGIKVWLNGINVHTKDGWRSYTPDEDRVSINLVSGYNRLLLKVSEGGYDWGFSAKICDASGQEINEIIYQLDKPAPELDTSPPLVSIVTPAEDSTVSSAVSISVDATDNMRVAKVEFYIDNQLQLTDTTLSYYYIWDTSAFIQGQHEIKVVAYDEVGNNRSEQINVKVVNDGVSPFVQTAGKDFIYKGKPIRFTGGTIYYIINLSDLDLIDRVTSLKSEWMNTLRVTSWLDEVSYAKRYDESLWRIVDRAIQISESHNMFVVLDLTTFRICLENNGYNPYLSSFEEWKEFLNWVINRTNYYTGKTYRDDPAIWCWAISGEPLSYPGPGVPTQDEYYTFYQIVSDYLRSLDLNHLIQTGGFIGMADYDTEGNPTQGMDYRRIWQLPNIDFGSVHVYSQSDIDDFPDYSAFAQKINKPLICEETGIDQWDAVNNRLRTDQERAGWFEKVYGVASDNSARALMFWNWGSTLSQNGSSDYNVYRINWPVTCDVLKKYSLLFNTSFVRTKGTQFWVNNHPLYIAGANSHSVWKWWLSDSTDTILENAAANYIDIIRVFPYANEFWSGSPSDRENHWQKLDYVIYKAKSLGIYVLIAPSWDYNGIIQFNDATRGAEGHYNFMTNPTYVQGFKDVWNYMLNRINTYTGIAYKDEPAIFGWDIMNEWHVEDDLAGVNTTLGKQHVADWYDTIGSYIKSIDSNHLLTTGMIGDVQPNSDFVLDHSLGVIDFCTIHLYHNQRPVSWGIDRVHEAHSIIGKPILLEEGNMHSSDAIAYYGSDDAGKAHYIDEYWGTLINEGIDGIMFWDWETSEDGYQTFPTHTLTCNKILNYSDQMRAKSTSAPFLRDWLLLGPFIYTTGDEAIAHNTDYISEATVAPREGMVSGGKTWFRYNSLQDYIDLDSIFNPNEHTVAYAHLYVNSPTLQTVQLRVGSDDTIKVWLNGNLVHDNYVLRSPAKDQDIVNVTLDAGWNRLLIKVLDQAYLWGFYARFTDRDGYQIGGLTYQVGINQSPVLSSIGDKSVDEGSLLEFTVSASDPDGDSLTYTAYNLPAGATFNASTRTFSWTPTYTQAGTYVGVTFEVSDGSLTNSESITIVVNEVDTTPPTGSIKINNNATYTKSTLVTLNLSAADTGGSGLDKMSFSNDNVSWSTPEAYATTKAWTLTTGDGTKTVYAKFSDKAGNWSGVYSDTIILDTTKPTITSITDLPDPFDVSLGQSTTLTYTLGDNLSSSLYVYVYIYNRLGSLVRTLGKYTQAQGINSVIWDGKDALGNSLPDDIYKYRIRSQDKAGNYLYSSYYYVTKRTSADKTQPTITSISDSPDPFDPEAGQSTTISYTLGDNLSSSLYVYVYIYNSAGTLTRTLGRYTQSRGVVSSATWNGKNSSGYYVPDATYKYRIKATDIAGNYVRSDYYDVTKK